MSNRQMIRTTLRTAQSTAFRLLTQGKYGRASDVALDCLLQVGRRTRTPETVALNLIAAAAHYAKGERNLGKQSGLTPQAVALHLLATAANKASRTRNFGAGIGN